jgi:hypothetical protein
MPDETPLSEDEIKEVKRLFGSPFFIPGAFKAWMGDQLALNIPEIPLSSLFGGRGIQRTLENTAPALATTGDATLYTAKVKGGTLQGNGRLRFDIHYEVTSPDASNNYFFDFSYGGTVFASPSRFVSGGAAHRSGVLQGELYAVNDPRVQFGYVDGVEYNYVTDSHAALIGAGSLTKDSTVDQDFVVAVRWTSPSGDDAMTLHAANLEIFNPLPFAAV